VPALAFARPLRSRCSSCSFKAFCLFLLTLALLLVNFDILLLFGGSVHAPPSLGLRNRDLTLSVAVVRALVELFQATLLGVVLSFMFDC